MSAKRSCVLAYSGGLDTSAILPWLAEHGYDVHAVLVDVGQSEDLAAARKRALRMGAASATVRDAKPAIVKEVLPFVIGLNARYEGYRLGTAIARPFIALEQIKLARELGCHALVHGATGKGNDQIRFEFAYRSLAPACEVIAPWKSWTFEGRADLAAYLDDKGIPHSFEVQKELSLDENLWHLSVEGGDLEDPHAELHVEDYLTAVRNRFAGEFPPGAGPDSGVELVFDKGVPVAMDGEPLDLATIVARLNGRFRHADWAWDLILENRFTGVKSRGLYINPAAKLLQLAAGELARNCLNKPTFDEYEKTARRYADLLYRGEYFSDQRRVVEAAARTLIERLNGEVTIRVRPAPHVARIVARNGLFTEERATFEASEFRHADAEGFIRLSWMSMVGKTEEREAVDEHAVEAGT